MFATTKNIPMDFFVFWKLSIECSKSISDGVLLTFSTNGCHCCAPTWHDVSTSTSVFCCSRRLGRLHVGLLLSGFCGAIQPIAKCRSISSTVHMLIKSLPLKKQRSPRGAERVAEISELAVSGTYAGHEVVPKKIRSAAQWRRKCR